MSFFTYISSMPVRVRRVEADPIGARSGPVDKFSVDRVRIGSGSKNFESD